MSECCVVWPRAPGSVCSLSDMSDDESLTSPASPSPHSPTPSSPASLTKCIDVNSVECDDHDDSLNDSSQTKSTCCYYPPNPYRRQSSHAPFTSHCRSTVRRLSECVVTTPLLQLRRCLEKAVSAGDTVLVGHLLGSVDSSDDRFRVLHALDIDGASLLHRSVRAGSLSVTRLLVAEGADPSLASRDGYTALHMAAWYNHTHIVNFLLARQT